MNILLLNHYAGGVKYGMEFRPYSFAREWVKEGHSVRIVAASYSHLRQRQPEVTGSVTFEELDGIHYCWVKTPSYSGNAARRAVNIFVFLVRLMVFRATIVKGFTPDVVVGSSTYPLDNIVVHAIAKHYHARHVYEVHDLWPMSLIDLGGMSPRHPFVLLMKWAERYAYRTADAVISLLPFAETHMLRHGLGSNKFFCVPNGVDISESGAMDAEVPAQHASLLRSLREQHAFIVGYTGGHAVSNALDSFVMAAMQFRLAPVAFVLVGDGTEKPRLMKMASMLGITNVHFLPPVPRGAVHTLLQGMDALFIGWQNKQIYRFGVSPNKLMDYMLAGKPIIHANCAGNDIVAESGCGISVPPEDPTSIAAAVSALMRMGSDTRDAMGRLGRATVLQHYQNKDLAKLFIDYCAIPTAAVERS